MHEDLLRHIWAKQLFTTAEMRTTDGRPIRILAPGGVHRGSGPDFRRASVEIGGIVYTGDIEFHRSAADWTAHGHHTDPAYNTVILHVVLGDADHAAVTESGRVLPALDLTPHLLAAPVVLEDHLAREEHGSRRDAIPCDGRNDEVEPELLAEWLQTLYKQRVRRSVARMHERLHGIIREHRMTIGEPRPPYDGMPDPDDIPLPDAATDPRLLRLSPPWEQLLFEEIMDALGYSRNRVPMKRLAEAAPLPLLRESIVMERGETVTSLHCEALLLHLSGLLPSLTSLRDQASRVHVHSLLTALRGMHVRTGAPLHRSEWTFAPARPSNFPAIRIAAGAALGHAIAFGSLFRSLITLMDGRFSAAETKREGLLRLLDPGDHPFWNHHYAFAEPALERHALLGLSRRSDIIMNALVPFTLLYASTFGDRTLAERCMTIAAAMPPLEENEILRRMEQQLMKKKLPMENAHQQQGVLELYMRYCREGRCGECEVGKAAGISL